MLASVGQRKSTVRAPADGYTLLLFGPYTAIGATLYDKLNFNFIQDVTPAADILRAAKIVDDESEERVSGSALIVGVVGPALAKAENAFSNALSRINHQ